jgi:hypothetical protein
MRRATLNPAVCGLLAALPTTAMAQNYTSTPFGGRSGSMGGASAALGTDASAPLLNPANLAGLDSDVLSLSANVYAFTGARAPDFFQLGPDAFEQFGAARVAGTSLSSSGFDVYPSSAAYFLRLGDDARPMTLALSLIDVNHTRYSFSGKPQVRFDDGAFRADTRFLYQTDAYYLGPSFAMQLAGGTRLGLSAFLVHQPLLTARQTTALRTTANNTQFEAEEATEYLDGASRDLQFVAGAQHRFGHLALGLSVALPSLHLGGQFERELKSQASRPGGVETEPSELLIRSYEGDLIIVRPTRFTAGVAYEVPQRWAIALDANVFLATSPGVRLDGTMRTDLIQQFGVADSVSKSRAELQDHALALDVALGGEFFLSDAAALRAGFFVDRSGADLPSELAPKDLLLFAEDRLGATAGVGFAAGAFQTDLGVMAFLGSGKIVSRRMLAGEDALFRADLSTYGALFFVTGSMDLDSLKRRVADQLGAPVDVLSVAADPGSVVDFGQEKTLTLGGVDPALAAFEGRAEMNGLVKSPVTYPELGQPRYDQFFLRAAQLRGAVIASRQIVGQAASRLDAPGAGAPRPAEIADLKQAVQAASGALEQVAAEGATLMSQAFELARSASSDFKGPQAVHAPAVAGSLVATAEALGAALGDVPGLLSETLRLLEALTAAGTTGMDLATPDVGKKPKGKVPGGP